MIRQQGFIISDSKRVPHFWSRTEGWVDSIDKAFLYPTRRGAYISWAAIFRKQGGRLKLKKVEVQKP